MKEFKENLAGRIPLLVVLVVLLIIILCLLSSCSVNKSLVGEDENLFEPRSKDWVIVGLEKDVVYCYRSDDSTKIRAKYWPNADTLRVGGCLLYGRRR